MYGPWQLAPAWLKRLRKGMGISQEKLADRLGVTMNNVQNWEIGRRNPDRLIQPVLAHLEQSISTKRR